MLCLKHRPAAGERTSNDDDDDEDDVRCGTFMLHIFPPIAHVTFNFILLLSGMYFWCLPVLLLLVVLVLLPTANHSGK